MQMQTTTFHRTVTFSVVILAVFMPTVSFGQAIVYDSLGLDSSSTLNKYEIAYLDSLFTSDKYDFNNKKIAFIIGDGNFWAKTLITKDKYFKQFKKPHSMYGRGLYILNETEKKDSGGYDAIIMAQCKAHNPKELINILSGKKQKEK